MGRISLGIEIEKNKVSRSELQFSELNFRDVSMLMAEVGRLSIELKKELAEKSRIQELLA